MIWLWIKAFGIGFCLLAGVFFIQGEPSILKYVVGFSFYVEGVFFIYLKNIHEWNKKRWNKNV